MQSGALFVRRTWPVTFVPRHERFPFLCSLSAQIVLVCALSFLLLNILNVLNVLHLKQVQADTISSSPQTALSNCPTLQCVNSTMDNVDWFPFKTTSLHAYWHVHYVSNNWKFVENQYTGSQYVLNMCGTLLPSYVRAGYNFTDSSTQENITINANVRFFTVPIQRLCLDETVSATFVELLGLRDYITLMDTTYVSSPCLLSLNASNLNPNSHYVGPLESTYGNLTLRAQQIEDHCDLVLGSNGDDQITDPKYVSFSSTADPGLLNRAEWIKFIGLFFNREWAAENIFDNIQSRYLALQTETQKQFNQSSSIDQVENPVVAFISFYAGVFDATLAAYKAQLIVDAGGIPWHSSTFTNATWLKQALINDQVQVLIDETYGYSDFGSFLSTYQLDQNDSNVLFLKNGQVYREDLTQSPGGGDDWFESSIPNADALLAEMVHILHPEVESNHTHRWFRNIVLNQSIQLTSSNECNWAAPTLPYEYNDQQFYLDSLNLTNFQSASFIQKKSRFFTSSFRSSSSSSSSPPSSSSSPPSSSSSFGILPPSISLFVSQCPSFLLQPYLPNTSSSSSSSSGGFSPNHTSMAFHLFLNQEMLLVLFLISVLLLHLY